MIKWYTKIVIPRFIAAEDGPTAVEYAVMIALIVVACIGSVQALATATRGSLDASSSAIQSVL
jgi:pilus assembly protein Flp/PilA